MSYVIDGQTKRKKKPDPFYSWLFWYKRSARASGLTVTQKLLLCTIADSVNHESWTADRIGSRSLADQCGIDRRNAQRSLQPLDGVWFETEQRGAYGSHDVSYRLRLPSGAVMLPHTKFPEDEKHRSGGNIPPEGVITAAPQEEGAGGHIPPLTGGNIPPVEKCAEERQAVNRTPDRRYFEHLTGGHIPPIQYTTIESNSIDPVAIAPGSNAQEAVARSAPNGQRAPAKKESEERLTEKQAKEGSKEGSATFGVGEATVRTSPEPGVQPYLPAGNGDRCSARPSASRERITIRSSQIAALGAAPPDYEVAASQRGMGAWHRISAASSG
jgi:hypothetical protein